jgi:hypothetical protein
MADTHNIEIFLRFNKAIFLIQGLGYNLGKAIEDSLYQAVFFVPSY